MQSSIHHFTLTHLRAPSKPETTAAGAATADVSSSPRYCAALRVHVLDCATAQPKPPCQISPTHTHTHMHANKRTRTHEHTHTHARARAHTQVGYGPTQARGFAFESESSVEWTHAWRVLSSLHGDDAAIEALYSANHSDALEAVHSWSESDSGVPAAVFDTMDEWFRSEASLLPVNKEDVLHEGSPHGALHEQMVGKSNTPTMLFTVSKQCRKSLTLSLTLTHEYMRADAPARACQ
jgi:hypothetical protein